MLQVYLHASQGKEPHAVRPLDEILVDNLMEVCFSLWAVIVVWAAGPESLLIELYLLHFRTAIDHGTEVGIAYRQCLQPMGCGLWIPELVLLCHDGMGHSKKEDHHCHESCKGFFIHRLKDWISIMLCRLR